jgi:hypothetical protein
MFEHAYGAKTSINLSRTASGAENGKLSSLELGNDNFRQS